MSACLSSDNGVKARKKYHCDLCGEEILKGDLYDRRTGVNCGDMFTMHMHPECHKHEQTPGVVDPEWYEESGCGDPAFERPSKNENPKA